MDGQPAPPRSRLSSFKSIPSERKIFMSRVKGTVKWFSDAKGYGFLQPEGGGSDIFVHFSAIETEREKDYKTLTEGQPVEFEVADSPRGLQAEKVVKL
jgi:cold shock protein